MLLPGAAPRWALTVWRGARRSEQTRHYNGHRDVERPQIHLTARRGLKTWSWSRIRPVKTILTARRPSTTAAAPTLYFHFSFAPRLFDDDHTLRRHQWKFTHERQTSFTALSRSGKRRDSLCVGNKKRVERLLGVRKLSGAWMFTGSSPAASQRGKKKIYFKIWVYFHLKRLFLINLLSSSSHILHNFLQWHNSFIKTETVVQHES